ncbi:DNA internalization-related competence protein ComEC/Rec2 [Maledivibacter halophilus]|uniref:Competence protein ComEC n=1 Tax=Maledivibacter halophilus TaxID=36842 RepID=A0A1T5LUM8_9FIRM|nr:DNA internalization-related competence protein ComEC/Rec2 [Maledivibacter halophilus]SKC79737.1 competence protein ComEC [Maledivibacter halophilus]
MYRRPIVGIAIAFILGIIIQYYFRINLKIIWSIVSLNMLLLFVLVDTKKGYMAMILLLSTVMLFGGLHMEYKLNINAPIKSFVNKKVEIIGDCIQRDMTDKSTYILRIESIKYNNKTYRLKSKSLLRVFKQEGRGFNNKRVLVRGILKEPDPARNPKMFNYKLYLKTQDIHTILSINQYNIKSLGPSDLPLFIRIRHKIKSYIYNETAKVFPGEEGKIALSIVFGDKKIIDEDLYNSFKLSGTAHALAVSGLHFGILFMFLDFILKIFKLKENYKAFVLLSLICFFAIIVGFSPSVIRASSMIILLVISNHIDRKYDLFAALALISLINVFVNPFMIFSVGFQLSFLAVISIGLFYSPIYQRINFMPEYLGKMIATTLSAQIGTSPIIAYHFNTFSLISLILNIPVVLLISFILPISLVFFVTLFINIKISRLLVFFDRILIKILISINSISSYLPFSSFNIISPRVLYLIIFYIGLILFFYRGKIPYINKLKKEKLVLLFLVFIFAINFIGIIKENNLKVTFIDVGQGDCILIETPKGKRVLIDGGKSEESILYEYLLKNRITHIDLACITHIHDDHIGGIIDIVENIKIGTIIIGTKEYSSDEFEDFINKCSKMKIPVNEFTRGKTIELEDEIILESIHPSSNLISKSEDDINNNSLACILKYKDFEVLFTGDIEKEGERETILNGSRRDIDVIKVSHHGSNTSSLPEFIDYYNPKIAVIQVGKNLFGHPNKETLQTLMERKIKIYRNDRNGAVIIESDGENIEIKRMIQ